jgi:hypothetical protein
VGVDFDRQQEVYTTDLDYTDERGWHQGEPMERRSVRFEEVAKPPTVTPLDPHLPRLANEKTPRIVGCTCGWRTPPDATDSDDAFVTHAALARLAPTVAWASIDRSAALRQELVQKAIAWVLADRSCEDHSATLTRVQDEVRVHLPVVPQAPHVLELLSKLEYEKIGFRLASQRAEKCDDEFRQVARKLVAALEPGSNSDSEQIP